ncbi:hypothetical protein GA0115249_10503 [Streptomyces sp. PpalLS-921]|nr:hypothetical protein GA0115249_10503 [Streptomyces sp. PpalLS-921]
MAWPDVTDVRFDRSGRCEYSAVKIVNNDLWGLIEPLLPRPASHSVGPAVSSGHPVRAPRRHWSATPALRAWVRLRADVLAVPRAVAAGRVFDEFHRVFPAELNSADQLDWSRCMWTVPTSAERGMRHRTVAGRPGKTGSRHHLTCDRRDTPLKGITTEANINTVTQTLALVNSISPVTGRPAVIPKPCSATGPMTPRTAKSCASGGSCQSSSARTPWAGFCTAWSRISPCLTISSTSPFAGNDEQGFTTPDLPGAAA